MGGNSQIDYRRETVAHQPNGQTVRHRCSGESPDGDDAKLRQEGNDENSHRSETEQRWEDADLLYRRRGEGFDSRRAGASRSPPTVVSTSAPS